MELDRNSTSVALSWLRQFAGLVDKRGKEENLLAMEPIIV
jgi:hypothetical protein